MSARALAGAMLDTLHRLKCTLSERDETRALAAAAHARADAPMVVLLRSLATATARAQHERRDPAACPVVVAIAAAIRQEVG